MAGGWKCPKCGGINPEKRTTCIGCNTANPILSSAASEKGSAQAVVPVQYPSAQQIPHNWKCPKCGGINPAQRTTCLGCNTSHLDVLIAGIKQSALRDNAVRELVRIGAPAVAPLLVALKDSQSSWAAADALGKIGWRPSPDESGAIYWVAKRKWDQCSEIGTPAVEPLIGVLKGSNGADQIDATNALVKIGAPAIDPFIIVLKENKSNTVRALAAGALGRLGDSRAVEPLILALNDRSATVGDAAVAALGQIGAQLKETALIARAVEPLIAALKDNRSDMRMAAAQALDKIGWRPGPDESGAAYWVAKRRWDKCIEIGSPAIDPLIVALYDSNGAYRMDAADTLLKNRCAGCRSVHRRTEE
jgi:hypothetical protein